MLVKTGAIVALAVVAAACGQGNSDNVMSPEANALEPADVNAALGPDVNDLNGVNATADENAMANDLNGTANTAANGTQPDEPTTGNSAG